MQAQRGILNPRAGEGRFTLSRYPASADLAAWVQRYWSVRWDLRGRAPHQQETLPFPCVHLVIGTHRPGVHGPARRRFAAELGGRGWVFGVKFRPAGFFCFTDEPMVQLVDRALPISALFGRAGRALEREVHAAAHDAARLELVARFLRTRAAARNVDAELASSIVDLAEATPSISRVDQLAEHTGLAVRALERLFRRHIGVTPKWVIRRFRVQQAAARLAGGAEVVWARMAHELGYFDQAHFIREFKAQVGRTPRQYAAWCAARPGTDPSTQPSPATAAAPP